MDDRIHNMLEEMSRDLNKIIVDAQHEAGNSFARYGDNVLTTEQMKRMNQNNK